MRNTRVGRTGRVRRTLVLAAAAALTITGTAPTVAAPITTTPANAPGVEVAPSVQAEVADRGRADFWIHFDQRPDLQSFHQIADWNQRRASR